MRHTKNIPAIMLILAAVSTSAFAATQTSSENDAMAVLANKVTLTQAIAAAEKHVNGSASKAEFENSKSGPVYEVEVVEKQTVYDVKVDPNKGTIISSKVDTPDQDDSEDE